MAATAKDAQFVVAYASDIAKRLNVVEKDINDVLDIYFALGVAFDGSNPAIPASVDDTNGIYALQQIQATFNVQKTNLMKLANYGGN